MKVVLDANFKNWILGAVIRESALCSEIPIEIQYVTTSRRKHLFRYFQLKYLKKIKLEPGDLVVNQRTLNFLVQNGIIKEEMLSRIRCHFTHESNLSSAETKTLRNLTKVAQVLVLNQSVKLTLENAGLDSSKISVIYGAIDRKLFSPSVLPPSSKFVLITGDAKGRKNPSKLMELVEFTPDIKFVICGKNWEKYLPMSKQHNLNLYKFDLVTNAKLMREASAYLTLSVEEGGPYPILEALASGTPVVSTPVGWAPEFINDANGSIVQLDATITEIQAAIKYAISLKLRTYNLDLLGGLYTWQEQAKLLFTVESR